VISQLRRNQTVRFRNRTLSVQQYFERYPGVSQTIRIGSIPFLSVSAESTVYGCGLMPR